MREIGEVFHLQDYNAFMLLEWSAPAP